MPSIQGNLQLNLCQTMDNGWDKSKKKARMGDMLLMSPSQLSSVQNPGWLFYIEDYTTQLYRG